MSVFLTSDHHFGHAAARTFYRRPFASVEDMDRAMIDRWNSVVEPVDEVWHLGEFAVRQSSECVDYLLTVLHGRKHRVIRNNDDAHVTRSIRWQSIQTYAEVTVDDTTLVLCHYPFRTWRDMARARSTCLATVTDD
jgi:calcineurin-like phosphoesterase family protein